ncbi:glycosyltransferase [Halomicrobium salinisoli]|uniref:glycosyltransferase n=1 Tax=Halomicrobium salinisoli TaxID=2878391 RepID=UPI001CEFE778|nr:glycosyltransferase [Halomicrobium salinisoli]
MEDSSSEISLSAVCSAYHAPDDARELLRSIRTSYERYERSDETSLGDFEFLAVLHESDTETIEALEAFSWDPLEVMVIENEAMTAARHAGIEAASGEYVAILDDDCVVAEDWLGAIVRSANEHDLPGCIQGAYYADYDGGSWYSDIEERRDRIRFDDGQADTRNLIIRKDTYEAIGGFDTEHQYAGYAEDLVLPERVRDAGEQFVLDDSIQAQHKFPRTLRGNLRRHFYYGTGLVHVKRYDKQLYRNRFSGWMILWYVFKQWAHVLRGRESDYEPNELAYVSVKYVWLFFGFVHGYYVFFQEQEELALP